MLLATLVIAANMQGCRSVEAPAPPASAPASQAALEALYRARVDSALSRYTVADADFMRHMIGHHTQALEMAALAPARASSPDVERLAARITTAQEAEIGLMRRWLEDRGLPVAGPGAGHAMASPGMLTPEQMRELEVASGRSFDRLFLTYMIQHHEGALTMVDDLFAAPGAARDASTFRIASGVQVDQRAEIARMESMLDALGAPGPPRPIERTTPRQ